MTPVARLKACSPGDFAIMTDAAELALSDRIHCDLIGTRLHLKNRRMAGVTLVPDSVKPMWKRGHGYSAVAAFPLETYVSVHSQGCTYKKDSDEKREQEQPKTGDRRPSPVCSILSSAISHMPYAIRHIRYFPPPIAGWHRPQVVAGNATFPWQTPQYCPEFIFSIVIGSAPFAI